MNTYQISSNYLILDPFLTNHDLIVAYFVPYPKSPKFIGIIGPKYLERRNVRLLFDNLFVKFLFINLSIKLNN